MPKVPSPAKRGSGRTVKVVNNPGLFARLFSPEAKRRWAASAPATIGIHSRPSRRGSLVRERYRGATITRDEDGTYRVSIDPESAFDTLKDARAFTRRWAKNPITDRASRYRAQRAVAPSPHCGYCGNPASMVDHIDGHEEHGEPENLVRSCRSCNVRKAAVMRAAKLGRLTRQYNPQEEGARNLAQWTLAVASIQRRDKKTGRLLPPDGWKAPMIPVKQAVEMIRATPAARRSEFAAQLAAKRHPRRGRRWRPSADVPF